MRAASMVVWRSRGLFDVAVVWAALTALCWYAFALVPIQLAAAGTLGLDHERTSSLLFIIWCTSGVGTVLFALVTRQPIALGSSFPLLTYLATLAGLYSFGQLMGGLLVAGAVVTLVGWLRIGGQIVRSIPPSIAMATFVGSVFGVLIRMIESVATSPSIAGATVGGYLLGCILRSRLLPPIGAAALGGLFAIGFGPPIRQTPLAWSLPPRASSNPNSRSPQCWPLRFRRSSCHSP